MSAKQLILALVLVASVALAALALRAGTPPNAEPETDVEVPRIVIVGHRDHAE